MPTQIIEKNGELVVDHTPCEYLKDKDLPVYYFIKDKVLTVLSEIGVKHYFARTKEERQVYCRKLWHLRNRDQYHEISPLEGIEAYLKYMEASKSFVV